MVRWVERTGSNLSFDQAYPIVGDLVASGAIIRDDGLHRYVLADDMVFPCIARDGYWQIKTALEKGM